MTLVGFIGQPFDVDIVLDEDPKGAATVRLFPASPTGLVLSPTTLSFDETDWNTPKQVSAVIKQNPLELGGVTNAQVVFAEITTSWGGADNITKDRFSLTVLELEPMVFLPGSDFIGSARSISHLGSVKADDEGGNLSIRVTVLSATIRGSSFNDNDIVLIGPSGILDTGLGVSDKTFTAPRDGSLYEIGLATLKTMLSDLGSDASVEVRVQVFEGFSNLLSEKITTLTSVATTSELKHRNPNEPKFEIAVGSYGDPVDETFSSWFTSADSQHKVEGIGTGVAEPYRKGPAEGKCSVDGTVTITGDSSNDGSGDTFGGVGARMATMHAIYEGSHRGIVRQEYDAFSDGFGINFYIDFVLS